MEKGRYRRTRMTPTFSPFWRQVIYGLLGCLAAGAHDDDHALGLGMAEVVEQVVLAARHLGELVHRLLDDGGSGRIVRIDRLAHLEIDIRILRRAAQDGMFGGESARAVSADQVFVDQRAQIFIGQLCRSW